MQKIFVFLLILLTGCSSLKNKSFVDNDYTTPPDFDVRKESVNYGQLNKISYYSKTTENNRSANIILPSGYTENKKYPVLFLLHGIGGDENEWLGANPNEVINNAVSAGKAKEMIVVIPNIRARHNSVKTAPDFYSVEHFREFDNFLNELKNDLIPYIESHYSVLPGRDNRAVAGLSMGGRSALHVGINLIDYFAYIGAFTPAVGILPYDMEDGLFTKETLTLPDKYKASTLLMMNKGSHDGVVKFWPDEYHNALSANGTKHIFYTVEAGHDFVSWKSGLYNFARRIFQ